MRNACDWVGKWRRWRKQENGCEKSAWVDYLPENYRKPDVTREKKTGTGFSNFEQRDYDFGELEKQLLESQEIGQEV